MTNLETLRAERCVACWRTSPRVTEDEAQSLAPLIPEWNVDEIDDVPRLRRSFRTKSYAQALELTQRIGQAAEAAGHHPQIVVEWRRVTVVWWTHAIGWLHRNDYIMAAKTDQIAATHLASVSGDGRPAN